ncbi:MAG TPA: hypothetical protein VGP22_14165 [Albitalea sp.]|jgi:hypothetical protein|nr:hypothetical protein [Albitalea sp.]
MDANQLPDEPDLSPARRYGLFVAGLAIALLGLTTLDVAHTQAGPQKQRNAELERSAECIVASAVFAGIHASPAP